MSFWLWLVGAYLGVSAGFVALWAWFVRRGRDPAWEAADQQEEQAHWARRRDL